MSGAKTGNTFLIAILAATVLSCAGAARMHAQSQQTGTANPTGSTPSSADATAYSAANPAGTNGNAANPAGESGGASSWKSGSSSFGIAVMPPAGSGAGANDGSWGTGTGSFGIKPQPGGIWRENGGGSMGTPNTPSTQGSRAGTSVPAALPGPGVAGPATSSAPRGARSGGVLASRSPSGAHPGSGARFESSNGVRSNGNKSTGNKRATLGAHRQPTSKSHAGASRESSAGSSSSHATTHTHSAFTPSHSSTMGGMH